MKKILIITMIALFLSGCSSLSVNTTPTIHNGTTIAVESYLYAVAAGELNSAIIWNKFGYNDDIDTTTDPEIIASFGGNRSFILSSPEILNISSSSANDANGGTGAHGLVIYGVINDSSGNRISNIEVVFLNGTNTVRTTKHYYGVNRASLFRAGSSFQNEGEINLIASTGGSTQGQLPIGTGTTEQGIFYVPTNKTFLANYLVLNINKLSGGSAPRITIRGYVRSFVSNADYEIYTTTIDTSVENTIELTPETPFVVGEDSVMWFEAETDTNNALARIRFSGILKDD